MTLEEMKMFLKSEGDKDTSVETVNVTVLPNEEEDEDVKETNGYLHALEFLEDAMELFDEVTDCLNHKIPVAKKLVEDMEKLSRKINDYLIDTDDDDDEDEDEVKVETVESEVD